MAARTASAALFVALLLASCGGASEDVPAACLGDPSAIERALARAPARVTLPDGTPLSTCVGRARDDAELQTLGTSLMRVADDLGTRARTDGPTALRLGYLLGATRRGVSKNPGLAANLGRRLEQVTLAPRRSAAVRGALEHGRRAGEAGG